MTRITNELDCNVVSAELLELFDHNSLDHLTNKLADHIRSCANCRREYEELMALSETFSTELQPDPGETYWTNFLPKLRWRLEQESRPSRRLDRSLIPSFGLTVLLILVLLKSPAPIAPPTWYSTISQDNSTTIASQIWNSQIDTYSLDTATDSSSIWKDYVSESDLDIVKELSSPTKYTSNDPVDALLEFDDEQLDALFQKLKDKPIIKSS